MDSSSINHDVHTVSNIAILHSLGNNAVFFNLATEWQ